MNKKKDKKPPRRSTRRKKSSTTTISFIPILGKRNREDDEDDEIDSDVDRPRKFQRTPTANLRKLTLEQKFMEKYTEESLRDQFQKELEYLRIQDSNLFDYDPFNPKKLEEKVKTPVRLPLKRERKRKIVKPTTDIYFSESDFDDDVDIDLDVDVDTIDIHDHHFSVTQSLSSPVIITDPIEKLNIVVPPTDSIELPSILNDKDLEILNEENQNQAEKDANTIQNIAKLKKNGLWNPKKISKIPLPPKVKTHWDFMLEEMAWMANDFRKEKKQKLLYAKRINRAITRKQREQALLEEKKKKEENDEILHIASFIGKQVLSFWSKIELIVKHKHEVKLEEKLQAARSKQLEFLVGQTERYSNKLAIDMNSPSADHKQQNKHGKINPLPRTITADNLQTNSTNNNSKHLQKASTMIIENLNEKNHNNNIEKSSSSTVILDDDDDDTNNSNNSNNNNTSINQSSDSTIKISDPSDIHSQNHQPSSMGNQDEILTPSDDRKEIISLAAENAVKHQPTGTTLSTTKIKTKIPSLLRGKLREYQHIGLDWLVSMYDAKLNGILADEMGLGKTIQTISLLAHLASEYGIWGPHLIVVPTTVMLNWERELKRWCPGFKILTYFGTQKERKQKRHGWSKANSFHVCITSYNLVSQDKMILNRKKWVYLILDEAQNIKNFKSQRWQVLLNFNTRRRLLLTGTPLQNNLMELWSLMHFLMPHIFQSHSDFKEWFCNPVNNMIEGSSELNESLISRLHGVLRPFILRRLKKDVEKQLPNKYEHVVPCSLSKRQRFLYDEFMSRNKTKESLATGNYLSILNILMQLRKVCNHPDLFEERSISSPLQISPISYKIPSLIVNINENYKIHQKSLLSSSSSFTSCSSSLSHNFLNPCFIEMENNFNSFDKMNINQLMASPDKIIKYIQINKNQNYSLIKNPKSSSSSSSSSSSQFNLKTRRLSNNNNNNNQQLHLTNKSLEIYSKLKENFQNKKMKRYVDEENQLIHHVCYLNKMKSYKYLNNLSFLGFSFIDFIIKSFSISTCQSIYFQSLQAKEYLNYSSKLRNIIQSFEERLHSMLPILNRFCCYIPPVSTCSSSSIMNDNIHLNIHCNSAIFYHSMNEFKNQIQFHENYYNSSHLFYSILKHRQLALPDKRLIQFDCGKLQKLASLLRTLKLGGHRCLIFTQMTRMLDILEIFLNLHGFTYLRLDGATKPDARQAAMERFNADSRIFCFILSTRSGGCGVNLIGADTVIFYDSDWNPAMDSQAQDRCHRIGQTREVHIYRLISTQTIEENILKKANQKRLLDSLAIDGGKFTTEFFQNVDIHSLIPDDNNHSASASASLLNSSADFHASPAISREQLQRAMNELEDESDVLAMKEAQKEMDEEYAEFNDDLTASTSSLNNSTATGANENPLSSSAADIESEFIKSKLTNIQKYVNLIFLEFFIILLIIFPLHF